MDLNLTMDGIKRLLNVQEQAAARLELILQIIDLDFPENERFSQSTLSDGFTQIDVFYSKEAQTKLNMLKQQNLKPVIKVQKVISKMSGTNILIVIIEFDIINDKYKTIIGAPIPFEEFLENKFVNPKGSNQIKQSLVIAPPKIITKPVVATIINQKLDLHKENQQVQSNNTTQTTKPKPSISLTNSIAKPKQFGSIYQYPQGSQSKELVRISDLYPNLQSWCIKARVIAKSERRTFQNKSKKVPGEFFTIDLLDNDNGKINCTFFDDACVKFADVIQQGKVYKFSHGQVKQNRVSQGGNQYKFFFNLRNQYQINFDSKSLITEEEDDKQIQINTFSIINIIDISKLQKDNIVDVIGIVKNDAPLTAVRINKTGEMSNKRTAIIFDDTGKIELTIWGKLAENTNLVEGDILCFKGMRISEYMGTKNLGGVSQTQVINDSHLLEGLTEYVSLSAWFQLNKGNIEFKEDASSGQDNITKSLQEIENDGQQNRNNSSWKQFSEVNAYLSSMNISKTYHYIACTTCSKKVQQQGSGYHCASCQLDIEEPSYKYMISCKISDASSSIWVSCQDQLMEQILAVKCKQFVEMDEDSRKSIVSNVLNTEQRFLMLSTINEYQGEAKPQHKISKIKSNNFAKETQEILKYIN